MDIIIKKLTPELIGDYFYFFDNVAFTDNSDWAGCYCVYYHYSEELLDEIKESVTIRPGESINRIMAERLIQLGTLCGYLAYLDGAVVGWCNVNDKDKFARLSRERRPDLWDDQDACEKVKSIVCFTIAPDMRRKGIATAMLAKACEDAAAEGYSYFEAYPTKGELNSLSYHGPLNMYEKLGFTVHKELKDYTVVRKKLSGCV